MSNRTTFLFETLSKSKQDLISSYIKELLNSNKNINLTAVKSFEDAMIKHVEDSLLGVESIKDLEVNNSCDIGSGGGIPGVIISIVLDYKMLLVDSSEKKCRTVQEILKNLALDKQISTNSKRIEEISIEKAGSFDLLTARALAGTGEILELATPLLKKEGSLLLYKAQLSEEEKRYAKAMEDITGLFLELEKKETLSDGSARTLLLYKKKKEPKIKLPRKPGFAQKKQLRF